MDARLVVGHSDRQLVATKPRAESLAVSADLDPRETGCAYAMPDSSAPGVQLVRYVPDEEERHPGLAPGVVEPGHPPADGLAVRAHPRSRADLDPEPRRDRVEVVGDGGDREPAAAPHRAFEHAPAERGLGGRLRVNRGNELQVLITERHDPVRRPPAFVPPAFGRIQSEPLAEADRGLIEIGDGVHDVVEPEHAATLVERPTYTRAVSRSLLPVVVLTVVIAPLVARAQEGFEREVDGFGFAVNLAFAPDGTMFVADKDHGEIRIVRDGQILEGPFATLPVQVTVNETGLLGVAVDPAFPDEPWVYAYYTGTDAVNHLVRIRAEGDRGSETQTLLDLLPATAGWHNGGDLAFGPDGKLYVSVGDGHDGSRSQDPNGIGGRILRLNPDGSIPSDNPLGPDNPTFALGIRNSFGLCFDPESGDLWETENGPSGDDEINLIEPGANYGWPEHLGPGGEPDYVDPVLDFPDTIVPTGCAVSDGALLFGEGYGGNLHSMPLPGPGQGIVARFDGGITDLENAPDGSVWVVTPTALYRSTGALERPSATVSPESEPSGGLVTAGGLLIAGLLIGGLLLMRSRLLRR